MAKEILIAESDKMVQEEFERIFQATGHHLIFAANDEEALLRGRLFRPDLMIGGRDLCQAARSDSELKDIRFIILLDLFEELSAKEWKRSGADGMISRPLNEEEVLNTVNPLIEGMGKRAGGRDRFEENHRWRSLDDLGETKMDNREEISLDVSGDIEEEEEIIELVDVVEEPESRMSIEDFALHQKFEMTGEIAPLDSWEGPDKEVVEVEKEFIPPSKGEEERMGDLSLQLEETPVEGKGAPEGEIFEKIELEEILRKVERLTPSIEKEWPAAKLEDLREERRTPPKQDRERYAGLDEFEAALKGEVSMEQSQEELQPFFMEEAKERPSEWRSPEEVSSKLVLEELSEEEFPEIFLEELTEELEKLEEEELKPLEVAVEVEEETTVEEDISELLDENVQPQEQILEELVRLEAIPRVDEGEVTVSEELIAIEPKGEVILPQEQALEEAILLEEGRPVEMKVIPQAETLGEPLLPPEQALEEVARLEAIPTYETVAPVEVLQEEKVSTVGATEIPKAPPEEIPPPVLPLDRRIEAIISKGVQELVQDFMTQVIPEMTQHMIAATLERIENMVKEVVPDLAEKAIQEEIRRLQKEEQE